MIRACPCGERLKDHQKGLYCSNRCCGKYMKRKKSERGFGFEVPKNKVTWKPGLHAFLNGDPGPQ